MSLRAPGPSSRAARSTRDTLAPRFTTSVSRFESRPAIVRCIDRCRTPRPQRWSATYCTSAPSRAKTSTAPHDSDAASRSGEPNSSTYATWLPSSAMISVRGNTATPASSIQRATRTGCSIRTPRGTYRNTPAVHSAAFSAANLSAAAGTASVARCFATRSGCSRAAVARSSSSTPFASSASSSHVSTIDAPTWSTRPAARLPSSIARAAAGTAAPPGSASRTASSANCATSV